MNLSGIFLPTLFINNNNIDPPFVFLRISGCRTKLPNHRLRLGLGAPPQRDIIHHRLSSTPHLRSYLLQLKNIMTTTTTKTTLVTILPTIKSPEISKKEEEEQKAEEEKERKKKRERRECNNILLILLFKTGFTQPSGRKGE